MKLGNTAISALYLGNTAISKAYLGDNLVYAKSSLPYRELEYIESDGTQKIVLPEINVTDGFGSFVLNIRFTKSETAQRMGLANSAGKYWGIDTSNRFALASGTYMSVSVSPFEWKTIEGSYDGNKATLSVDGTTISKAKSSAVSAYGTFCLLGIENSNSYNCYAQLAPSQFFNTSGALVLDLVPVLDDDGIPCLYDKLAGGLYYSTVGNQFGYKLK